MINFPDWVELPKRQSKQQLAAKRLRYMLSRAALERVGYGNISTFAISIGLERNTVHLYVKNGRLSVPAATMAEEVFGKELIRAEWLLNPLAIGAK